MTSEDKFAPPKLDLIDAKILDDQHSDLSDQQMNRQTRLVTARVVSNQNIIAGSVIVLLEDAGARHRIQDTAAKVMVWTFGVVFVAACGALFSMLFK